MSKDKNNKMKSQKNEHSSKKKSKSVDYKELFEEKQKEYDLLLESLKRLQADFDNYRKRVQDEKEMMREYLLKDLFLSLIPSINNFELSLKFSDAGNFKQGVEMIFSHLKTTLETFGLKKEEFKQGDDFDPRFHHPIEVIYTKDEELDNKLSEVISSCYLLKESVLKPADVKVYSFKTNDENKSNNKDEDKDDEEILNALIKNQDQEQDINDEVKSDLKEKKKNSDNSKNKN